MLPYKFAADSINIHSEATKPNPTPLVALLTEVALHGGDSRSSNVKNGGVNLLSATTHPQLCRQAVCFADSYTCRQPSNNTGLHLIYINIYICDAASSLQ